MYYVRDRGTGRWIIQTGNPAEAINEGRRWSEIYLDRVILVDDVEGRELATFYRGNLQPTGGEK